MRRGGGVEDGMESEGEGEEGGVGEGGWEGQEGVEEEGEEGKEGKEGQVGTWMDMDVVLDVDMDIVPQERCPTHPPTHVWLLRPLPVSWGVVAPGVGGDEPGDGKAQAFGCQSGHEGPPCCVFVGALILVRDNLGAPLVHTLQRLRQGIRCFR